LIALTWVAVGVGGPEPIPSVSYWMIVPAEAMTLEQATKSKLAIALLQLIFGSLTKNALCHSTAITSMAARLRPSGTDHVGQVQQNYYEILANVSQTKHIDRVPLLSTLKTTGDSPCETTSPPSSLPETGTSDTNPATTANFGLRYRACTYVRTESGHSPRSSPENSLRTASKPYVGR
jgi:hypothetical protein